MYKSMKIRGKCIVPYLDAPCRYNHQCNFCELALQIRKNRGETVDEDDDLLSWRDALPMTKKSNGADFYRRVVILKPEVLRARGITVNLLYQIYFCDGGSGTFASNPAGIIDGFLVADRSKRFMISRQDVFGVPNGATCERYYDIFGINLNKEVGFMK